MARRYDTISFLTDYGNADEFVGVVKSVVRDLAPHVQMIDLTHEIKPFDIRAGSLALARTVAYLPSGIVLAVVDPGVGTTRRAVAIEVADGEGVFVGPDNGLLAPAIAMAGGAGRAVLLTNLDYQLESPGSTFAGRDIFAPAAAHLCNGIDLYDLGEPIESDLLMPGIVPLPRVDGAALVTEVLWVDRFGNCQLNVGPDEIADFGEYVQISVGELAGAAQVRAGRRCRTFAELGAGTLGLVTDSYGMIALCLDQRSAAAELDLGASDQVVLEAILDAGAPSGAAVPVNFRRA